MSRTTLAVDNGVTGSVAVIGPDGVLFEAIPTKESLEGKAGKVVRRIDHAILRAILSNYSPRDTRCYIEKPFTGGPMFVNTMTLSARAYESVVIVMELLEIGTTTVSSKDWQRAMLGTVKGSAELKKASMLRGCQMYPALAAAIKDHGDADSLLMAHYYHKQNT